MPAVFLPFANPIRDAVFQVLGIGVNKHSARLLQGPQSLPHRGQFHSIIDSHGGGTGNFHLTDDVVIDFAENIVKCLHVIKHAAAFEVSRIDLDPINESGGKRRRWIDGVHLEIFGHPVQI